MMTDSSIDRYEIPNLNQNEKKSSPPINVVNQTQRRPSAMISNIGLGKNHPAKVVRIMDQPTNELAPNEGIRIQRRKT